VYHGTWTGTVVFKMGTGAREGCSSDSDVVESLVGLDHHIKKEGRLLRR
jgi:hypothetical protein